MNLLTDKEWLEINEIIKEIYACEDIKTLGYTFLSLSKEHGSLQNRIIFIIKRRHHG